MQTYYGLNRQGAAASGRYTRTPVPMGVPGIKSPFAAQALADPTAPALSDIAPQRRPGVPGEGEAPGISTPGPESPAATRAREDLARSGYSVNPMDALGGRVKTGLLNTGVALALDAPVSTAVKFGAKTMAALPGTVTTLGGMINKGVPIEQSIDKIEPEYEKLAEEELATGVNQDPARVRSLGKYAPVPLTTQAYRKILDTLSPKKVIDPGAPPGAIGESGLGQPGSQPSDYGHEARMGLGVGDVAGTQEAADIPGTGDKPVGKDYGNRTEPGGAPGGPGLGGGGMGGGRSEGAGDMGHDSAPGMGGMGGV